MTDLQIATGPLASRPMKRENHIFSGPDICALPAVEVVELLCRREVSPLELVEASLNRIEAVEPQVNAVVTRCADRAREAASAVILDPDDPGFLHGLPIGIKDLTAVAGVRTTQGTIGFADHVPDTSDPLVTRLEGRGGIVVGKTNTPEFGAGANTFNPIFGYTRNPYDLSKSAAGSSGGAAVSLATGEVWLSHGSDSAGSLRTPASHCGVVGLRPSFGLCATGSATGFDHLAVNGPMARTVEDCALFLDAMTGLDLVAPFSHPQPRVPYLTAARTLDFRPKIAWSPTLGGFAPCETEIGEVLSVALGIAEGNGAVVEEDCPDIANLNDVYRIIRGFDMLCTFNDIDAEIEAHIKPVLAENLASARNLTGSDLAAAATDRTTIYQNMRSFFANYDVLACPVVGRSPTKAEVEYPSEVAGQPMEDYVDWLRFSYLATTAGLPALSLPVGQTADGMPVGLQLIGPPRGEARLLQVARFLEIVLGWPTGPIDPCERV